MAMISSHVLNAVNGTHAGHVNVSFFRLNAMAGQRQLVFESQTDAGGRLQQEVNEQQLSLAEGVCFELVFQTGDYFKSLTGLLLPPEETVKHLISNEVVFRFEIHDAQERYHIPMMLSPHSYSLWWSQ